MKKLFAEYLHMPESKKITEKVIVARMVTTAAVIVACLAAMGITAYAFFSYNISSGINILKSAYFEAEISVTDKAGSTVEPVAVQENAKVFRFTTPDTYTVRLRKGDSTASTGFCILYIADSVYHTQQIGVDISTPTKSTDDVNFQIQVNEACSITIESHWGTSSHYDYISTEENALYITSDDPLKLILVGTAPEPEDSSKTDTEKIPGISETEPKEIVHTVVADEVLWDIAKTHGVSVERIAKYNAISNPSLISIGQEIKIPPKDWVMPEDPVAESENT